MDRVRCGELVRYLKTGVAAPDHEHGPVGDVVWPAVLAAVELVDVGGQVLRDRGNARRLKRPGGDHDLIGLICAIIGLDEVTALACPDGPHAAIELEWELEVARVASEVFDDLVARRVVAGVAGERSAGESVVARRREQPQRVPARPPHACRGVPGVEDPESPSLTGEVVAEREPGLATSD